MLTNDDLQAIKEIVKGEVDPVKARLEAVEIKVELLNKKIDETQKETIVALTDVNHTGYNLHEERITRIEEQLNTSQAH